MFWLFSVQKKQITYMYCFNSGTSVASYLKMSMNCNMECCMLPIYDYRCHSKINTTSFWQQLRNLCKVGRYMNNDKGAVEDSDLGRTWERTSSAVRIMMQEFACMIAIDNPFYQCKIEQYQNRKHTNGILWVFYVYISAGQYYQGSDTSTD